MIEVKDKSFLDRFPDKSDVFWGEYVNRIEDLVNIVGACDNEHRIVTGEDIGISYTARWILELGKWMVYPITCFTGLERVLEFESNRVYLISGE